MQINYCRTCLWNRFLGFLASSFLGLRKNILYFSAGGTYTWPSCLIISLLLIITFLAHGWETQHHFTWPDVLPFLCISAPIIQETLLPLNSGLIKRECSLSFLDLLSSTHRNMFSTLNANCRFSNYNRVSHLLFILKLFLII